MTGDEVGQVFETRFPQEEIDRLCQPCGVIERPRKLDLGMVVRAVVISARTCGGAYRASMPSRTLGRSRSSWWGPCVVVTGGGK